MPARLKSFFNVPLLRRLWFHAHRVTGSVDRHFFVALASGLIGFVAVAALAVTVLEKPKTFGAFGQSFYWALTTVMGQGDSS